jgi:triosephosphate isomerase
MKPLIVANWKMNPQTLVKTKKLFNVAKKEIGAVKGVEVVVCPPVVYLSKLSGLTLGAQNCFWKDKGAFTGEISPFMLKDIGCKYVIIGHSERRRYFKETCAMVNKKLKAALANNLKPILCIDSINQVKRGLKGISKKEIKKIVIAYEPIFAIGTGKACSIAKAKKMNFSIRKILGEEAAILYGGSVNSKNAKDFIEKAQFQGLLIGGASLNPKEFVKIIKKVSQV